MSAVTERIEQLRKALGFKRKNIFSDKIGVKVSTYSHFTSEKHSNTKFDYSVLVKIVETFPETNAEWLLTGKGEMFLEEGIVAKRDSLEFEIIEKFQTIPEEKKKDYYFKIMTLMID